jgi:hypothetical protein
VATYKEITSADIKTTKSFLNQLVDVIQEDISGSTTRKKYQVFVTGGIGPGITSSLFQTVYDQDFSLQTANAVVDLTAGLFSGSHVVTGSQTGVDSNGKVLFASQSVMIREKVSIYRQMAQNLLGNADSQFTAPFAPCGSATDDQKIGEALFICFKRLFSRDAIKRESFGMKFFQSASWDRKGGPVVHRLQPNLNVTSNSGSAVYTDVGSSTSLQTSFGGTIGNVVDSSDSSRTVGNIFYQRGIVILDMKKVISGTQHVSGAINAMIVGSPYADVPSGMMVIGDENSGNRMARFIPDLLSSASMDNILDHFASCRFGSSGSCSITFQNETAINSTLIFCRIGPDEFNYSSNPTYTDTNGRINVIDIGSESTQKSFSYFTTVGLYDASDNLLAVAKMSRPIQKSDENDLTIRVRLDF